MADNIGPKIALEGEAEFKKAIADINRTLKTMGTEMKAVTSAYDRNDKSVESLTAKNQVLVKQIDAQKTKLDTLKAMLDKAKAAYGENDAQTQKYQQQVNLATAALNKMERELEANNKALDNAGKELDEAEKQADEFGREIKKTADQADDAGGRFEKLGGVLKGIGVAMGAALAAIGTAAVGAGKALVGMSVNSAAYADEILTLSTVTGMSTDSLQAYKYAAELVDVSLNTLTGSMARNVRSMSSARKGTGEIADAYRRLGVSVTDMSGNLRDSETVYWETIDALGKVSNETERDALAMQIFGKSAQELNPLIAQGSAGIAELTEEAKRMGAVMSEDSLNALGKFDDSIQRLKAGGEAAKNMLGTVLLPQLQILADDGVALLGEFTRGLSEANGDWTKISEVIGNTVGSLVNMLMENLPKLIRVGLDIVTSIGGAIVDNLPVIINAAVQIVMTLSQALIDALPQITDGALQLVMALVQGIIDNLPALVEAAVQMIATLASGIADALPELIPAILETIDTIVTTLTDNLPLLIDAALRIIMALAKGLIDALPKLIQRLPEIIKRIVRFFVDNLPEIIKMGIALTTELAKGLVKAIPELVKALPEIIMAILEGLGELLAPVLEIGKNIVRGLWNGISSMITWVKEKIKGFASSIVNGIKGFLGISSPSKVFAQIGESMGEGVGIGFIGAMKDVERDMQRSIPTAFDAPSLKYASSMSGLAQPLASVSGGPVVVQLVANERLLGEVTLPAISRGLAMQRVNLAMARGSV